VQLIDFLIGKSHLFSARGVSCDIGVENVFDHALHQRTHPRNRQRRRHGRRLDENEGALGDVLRIVADPLQFVGDLQSGDCDTKVGRHRLTERENANDSIVDFAL